MDLAELEKLTKREKEATGVAVADVIQLLSHDTSSTRRQLIEVLRGRIDVITAETETDSFFNSFDATSGVGEEDGSLTCRV